MILNKRYRGIGSLALGCGDDKACSCNNPKPVQRMNYEGMFGLGLLKGLGLVSADDCATAAGLDINNSGAWTPAQDVIWQNCFAASQGTTVATAFGTSNTYSPSVTLSGTLQVGNTWSINITGGPPNSAVVASDNGVTAQYGTSDANGNYSASGVWGTSNVGSHSQQWTVGGIQASPVLNFTVAPASIVTTANPAVIPVSIPNSPIIAVPVVSNPIPSASSNPTEGITIPVTSGIVSTGSMPVTTTIPVSNWFASSTFGIPNLALLAVGAFIVMKEL
jgi:hypothetical protein